MTRLRLFVVISSSEIGGAERCLVAMLKGLASRGVEASIACPGSGPMVDEYRTCAARVWPLDFSNVFDLRTVLRLSSLMREEAADIVHTHLWNADVLGGLAALHVRKPAVSTVHGAYHLPIGVAGVRGLKRRALSGLYRGIYACFDRVVVFSNYIRDDLGGRAGIRVANHAIDVIAPGIDLSRLPAQAAALSDAGVATRREGPPRIINVANFFAIKGHQWLIRALPRVLAQFPTAQCLFVGDGPERRAMEALAAELRIGNNVVFTGSVSNPFDLVVKSDVFVLPSVSEGFALTILEAGALGIPVIASSVGGIPEIIENGRTGLLVPPRDSNALAEAIISMLSDPVLAQRLRAAGLKSVRARFSSEAMVDRISGLYRRLAEANGPRS